MLQEVKDLQNIAVATLFAKLKGSNKSLTFRAPTGSGKTRMMADLMHRVLSERNDVIFIVSTLSKGDLAGQNYKVFKECADRAIFPKLKPYQVSSEISGEERLFIPDDYNVYVLARDLYKEGSRLMRGALVEFIDRITGNLFGNGQNKQIYLIKDECHQATSNLDELSSCFTKIVNISATPKLSRGQTPDVEITDDEAVTSKLIKRVELGAEEDDFETALFKFEEIKKDYRDMIGVNPCLIVQISNKDKAEDEFAHIEGVLNKTEHQGLKWMLIVNENKKCKTNDKVGKLPVERWKDYAKENASTVDVIIFKLAISEGWDIPRACMLYQVRDTQSKQLDEQVMGRVRRNPRLVDFEELNDKAKELATTAWIWGILPDNAQKSCQVKLFGDERDIPCAVKIKTTHLKPLTERRDFDIERFLSGLAKPVTRSSIFQLYTNLQKVDSNVASHSFEYAGDDIQKWLLYAENIQVVQREYNSYICNYADSMEVVKDDSGEEKLVSFPMSSVYTDNANYENISNWVWKRKGVSSNKFSFDSEAEREWAAELLEIANKAGGVTSVGERNPNYRLMRTDGTMEPERLSDESKALWGKNYLVNSEIRFEYYLDGTHFSYPDFVMKDKQGRIHLFEVKSVNVSSSANFDTEEYKRKIFALEECYKQCSLLTDQIFYLPIQKDEEWHIKRFMNGEESNIGKDALERFICGDTLHGWG